MSFANLKKNRSKSLENLSQQLDKMASKGYSDPLKEKYWSPLLVTLLAMVLPSFVFFQHLPNEDVCHLYVFGIMVSKAYRWLVYRKIVDYIGPG
jgi:hypothetical protein